MPVVVTHTARGRGFDLGLGAVVMAVLVLPLLVFQTLGLDLVGMAEESVGYRYFYSLRLMAGDVGTPWLPQGQLIGLVHQAIHGLLSLLGYPADVLGGRVVLFSFFAALLPLLLTGAALPMATSALSGRVAKSILAAAVVVAAFQARAGGGYHLLLPDYYSWVMPMGLFALAWALRLLEPGEAPDWRSALWLGAFTGACIAIKPTYLALPLLVGCLLLWRCRRPAQLFDLVVVSALTALAVVFVISLIYYRGDYTLVASHFSPDQFGDLRADASAGVAEWIEVAVFGALDLTTIAIIFPVVLLLSLIFLPGRVMALLLLPASGVVILVAFSRFYPPTLVETCVFGIVLAAMWLQAVVKPLRRAALTSGLYSWTLPGEMGKKAAVGVLAVLLLAGAVRVVDFFTIFLPVYRLATVASTDMHAYLDRAGGRSLFLIPSNDSRPLALETAVFKGGLDLNDRAWATSPVVAALAPNRFFQSMADSRVNALDFSTLVYVTLDGREDAVRTKLANTFGLPLEAFNCDLRRDLGLAPLNFFLPATVHKIPFRSLYAPADVDRSRILVACSRKPLQTRSVTNGELRGVHFKGNRIFAQDDENYVEFVGTNRSVVFLPELGGWDRESASVNGAFAHWIDGGWQMDTKRVPVYRLKMVGLGQGGDYWTTDQKDAPEVTVIEEDDQAKYLRVRAARSGANVRFYANNLPANGPVAVRFTVRAPRGARSPTAVLILTGADGKNIERETIVPADGEWHSVVLTGVIAGKTSGDHFSIGYTRAHGDERFELRAVEVFNAAMPE